MLATILPTPHSLLLRLIADGIPMGEIVAITGIPLPAILVIARSPMGQAVIARGN